MSDQMDKIEKMLESLLRSQNHLWWIGGYAYGRTEGGDPFVLLYAANEKLQEKICRVYPRQFDKLPVYVPTANIPQNLPASNPNRTKALQANRFYACPLFQIVTYDGRETKMGRERRFGDVLVASEATRMVRRFADGSVCDNENAFSYFDRYQMTENKVPLSLDDLRGWAQSSLEKKKSATVSR